MKSPPVTVEDDPNRSSKDELLSLPIRLQAKLIHSDYPIYEIHLQSLPDYVDEVSVNLEQSRDSLLIYKNDQSVTCRLLNDTEKLFFVRLEEAGNLLQTLEVLRHRLSAESLSEILAFALGNKLLTTADSKLN